MFSWIKARRSFPWRALWRPRRRIFILLWVALGTWDLLVAQFLPPSLAEKAPRIYDGLAAMSGWLPLWAWAFIGLGILLALSIEYGVRQKGKFPKADLERWRSNNEMKIWQAGCLWGGIEPGYPVTFKNPAYSKFSMLLSAAETGELELVLKKPEDKLAHSIVSRKNLIDYANKRNIKIPEFLEVKSTLNVKETVKPIILAELETTVSPIGGFTPACAIRITNTGPELEGKCLVQIEDHRLKMHMPDPLVIRTEGQIQGNRTGRFTLSTGQPKLVPILFRVPAHLGHFKFIGEDGKNYDFVGDSAEFVVAIYGADNPTKVRVRLSDGQDWKPNFEMEYC